MKPSRILICIGLVVILSTAHVNAQAFGEGMMIVGAEIEPGTYRSLGGERCYWERLAGFGGGLGDILANDNAVGPTVVTIEPTDVGFSSRRCGEWTADLAPITVGPDEPFGDGTYIVGVDVAPGTWRADGGERCYWQRMRGFAGQLSDIIANGNPSGAVVVTLADDDIGFKSARCGDWSRL